MTKFLGILSISIGIGLALAINYVAENASEIERQERIRKWQKIEEAKKNNIKLESQQPMEWQQRIVII